MTCMYAVFILLTILLNHCTSGSADNIVHITTLPKGEIVYHDTVAPLLAILIVLL